MTVKFESADTNKKTIEVESFNHYIDIVSEFKERFYDELMLFRGQNCDKPLLPKLGRKEMKTIVSDLKEFESIVFHDFKRRYQPYSKNR